MAQETLSFGIGVLDERLPGLAPGGVHVLIGGPGTGKTVAALQFLREGIRDGGRVAHLTQARPEDVVDLAAAIGIDLAGHLREGEWMLLGYRSGFRERYRRTLDPQEVFDELRGFLGEEEGPHRLVIDTGGPLIESRESDNGAELLVDVLSELRSTVLLTFQAEDPGSLDRAFDFISQRASLILHLTLSGSGRREFIVRKTVGPLETPGAISFEIQDGIGIVVPRDGQRQRATDVEPEVRRRILLLDLTGQLHEELRLWLTENYELWYRKDPVDVFPELAQRDFGLVAVHVNRDAVDRGLHVMRQLRRTASRPPILVMCESDVRAVDRARALRTGADDFLSGDLHPEELASRIEALLRRSRSQIDDADVETVGADLEPTGIEPEQLREIVLSRLEGPGAPIFSLIVLSPKNGKSVDALASHVADVMRHDAGDKLCVVGERVEVYLHGALASHAERFLQRVRTESWKKVAVEVYTSPTDRQRLLELIGK